MTRRVVLLDYGSGNLRSAERALLRVGAEVEVTADHRAALAADGLVVPGVGAFAACMRGLEAVKGPRLIDDRLAGGRPVLGICVGLQVLFERGVEFADGEHTASGAVTADGRHTPDGRELPGGPPDADRLVGTPGCGQWPGVVERLDAPVLPHMGWNTVDAAPGSTLFSGLDPDERFYFVHSYAVRSWTMPESEYLRPPLVTWADHGGPFVAAVENGPLAATQFHPEKSGDAGAALLANWVGSL